jgi:hypothetical protein
MRADKSVRPSQLNQVVTAGGLRRELGFERGRGNQTIRHGTSARLPLRRSFSPSGRDRQADFTRRLRKAPILRCDEQNMSQAVWHQVCDRPKIAALKQQFPELFVEYQPKK